MVTLETTKEIMETAKVLHEYLVSEGYPCVEKMTLLEATTEVVDLARARRGLFVEWEKPMDFDDDDDDDDEDDLENLDEVEIDKVIDALYPYLEAQGISGVDNLTWGEAAAKVVDIAENWQYLAKHNLKDLIVTLTLSVGRAV